MGELDHIVSKVRAASRGAVGPLSRGEKLMAALVLNRPDWLAEWGDTIADAIDRVGAEWVALIPRVARLVEEAEDREADAKEVARKAMELAKAKSSASAGSDAIDCSATLVTYGNAPGYRDASFTLDLTPIGAASSFRVRARIRPEDAEPIVRHLHEVHAHAWSRGKGPLDLRPGEQRPRWIDRCFAA